MEGSGGLLQAKLEGAKGRRRRGGGGKKEDGVEAIEKVAQHWGQSGLDTEPTCPPGPRLRIAPKPLRLPAFSPVGFPMEACVLVHYLLFSGVDKVWSRLSPSGCCRHLGSGASLSWACPGQGG